MSVSTATTDSGYSPTLHIELELHGQRFDVAEMGPEFLRVRVAVPAPPGHAVVRVSIDGRPILYHIDLFDGIDPSRKKQAFRRLGVAGDVAA